MSETVKVKKSSNLLKIITVVFLGLILIGGAGFGGYYLSAKGTININMASKKESSVKEAYFAAIEEKLVNLADTDAKRYMKVTITVAYDSSNKKISKELEEKKDAVVDTIISTIRSKKAADLEGQGVETLKKEILTRINSILENGQATNVYYKDLLIQ